ncbi:MAG TPA: membrane protein insertase YidC, partial [Gemmatimonadales bacterium]|nr:membrane protein insertase YidC [Gemmatimonadales bacterium]
PTVAAAPAETLSVSSPLFEYQLSTRGGGLIQATLEKYQALDSADRGRPVRLVPNGVSLNQLALLQGNDTVSLADWDFTASRRSLTLTGPDSLTLHGSRGGLAVDLTYRFSPETYRIGVSGRITGLGPVGGNLLIGMGDGMRQTEGDSSGNLYEYGIVTKTNESELTRFSKLKAGQRTTLNGPFEWAAVKSKYFVTALLAFDTASSPVSGVTAYPPPGQAKVTRADITFGMPVAADGRFDYQLYAGPMEYPRMRAIGHDFYDINPYGWPGFRTLIRPVAVAARWLLVWMHEHLSLAYGIVLIIFGVLIRIILWPLNQKGMRASIRMQALQPEMQRIQEKYKNEPSKLQSEVMGLYKREGVNPFSGCWPMLLPWPVLLALFFVFQTTIELRGQAFLWLPDLSLKDPLFVLPVLMGMSMFAVNGVGMKGMPSNPQSKMMLYFLPVMMTVLFLNFASGLNLYYFVQNVVSIPQQWYLAQERLKARAAQPAPPARKK